jgi:hypothetical protein
MQLERFDLFPVPIHQIAVPEFTQYHDEVIALFQGKIDAGEITAHQHGYGYQTRSDLFSPNAYGKQYFVDVLAASFRAACEEILYSTRTGSVGEYYFWVNTLTVGWANIQTSRTWNTEPPWHSHLPATLSGCYYVSTSSREGEGNLQFMSPLADNIFQPQTVEITPKAGHLIIFPSFLRHRPSLCPHTERIRIALCIDSHWTVQMRHQLPPEKVSQLKRRFSQRGAP